MPSRRFNAPQFRALGLLLIASLTTNAFGEIPDNPKEPKPGLELGTWTIEPWGNPGSTEQVAEEERKVLKVTFTGGKKEKAAFKHLTGSTADPKGKIRLHVYAPKDKNPKVAVAISTSPKYVWHESKAFQLNEGWNRIEIELGKEVWKTKQTEWLYKTAVKNLNQIHALDFLVFNGEDSGWMLLEGLELDLDETGKRVVALIEDLTSKDPKKRAEAEGELVKIGKPAVAALQHARASKRPEVAMRARWALKKIESKEEELPEDPALQKQILQKKEKLFYEEVLQRTRQVQKRLQFERGRIGKILREAQGKLARGRQDTEKLKYTSEEHVKALKDALDALEELTKEVKSGIKPAEKPARKPTIDKPKPETQKVEGDKPEAKAPKADPPPKEKVDDKKKEEEKKDEPKRDKPKPDRRAWEGDDELDE